MVNVQGLLHYLAEKINVGNLCIYCENFKTKDFKTGESVKKHMIDRGHCFMNSDNFEEFYEFYNFDSIEEAGDNEEDWEDD